MTTTIDPQTGEVIDYFETDQNVFVGVGGQDNDTIHDLTTNIRANDYITAMNQFLKTLEMQVGLSTGTFSFDAQGLKTATEVVSENSMTYQTRNSHLNNIERAIQELIITIFELASAYDLYSGAIPTLSDIELNFDDGIFLDKISQLDYYLKATAGGAYSKRRMIMKVFDVPEEEADKILAEIAAESQPVLSVNDNLMYGQTTGDDE